MPIDNMTCLFRKKNFTEIVELGKRSVYTDVSQIEHNMMRMKTIYYMSLVMRKPAF